MGLADNSLMDFVKSSIADEKAVKLQDREDKKNQQENVLKEKQIQADLERIQQDNMLKEKQIHADLERDKLNADEKQ